MGEERREEREKEKGKGKPEGKKGDVLEKETIETRDNFQTNAAKEKEKRRRVRRSEERKVGEELVIIHVTADRAASGRDSCSLKPSTLSRAS